MVQLKSEHHAVAAPPGFSVTAAGAPKAAWWEPLAKFYDEAQKQGYGNGGTQMLLHSQLSQALELLKQDPAWNSSGAAELLQKTLKKAVPNEMLRVVKELLDFVALGQSRLRQRDLRTQSYSDQGQFRTFETDMAAGGVKGSCKGHTQKLSFPCPPFLP